MKKLNSIAITLFLILSPLLQSCLNDDRGYNWDEDYIPDNSSFAIVTILQDMPAKGKTAVDFMIQKLEGKALTSTEKILPTYLVKRESVKSIF